MDLKKKNVKTYLYEKKAQLFEKNNVPVVLNVHMNEIYKKLTTIQ